MLLDRGRFVIFLWLAALLTPTAWADGAFPDSFGILLPADQPNRTILATNFGVLVSDDGLHWYLACEQAIGTGAFIYQEGPSPQDELLAATIDGLARSTDGACTWSFTTGALTAPDDVFADPTDAGHVLALSRPVSTDGGVQPMEIFSSSDGAATFDAVLYNSAPSTFLTGIEVARSNASIIYATRLDYTPEAKPSLLRSADSGGTWQQIDLTATLGQRPVRIAAVDPENADRVFLRVEDPGGLDVLAIADQGGQSVRIAQQLPRPMSAFLRRANGDILVSTEAADAFISTDQGATFQTWPYAPHLRALAERNGRLYAAGDNTLDGFAIAYSDDSGNTWYPMLNFQHICGIDQCGSLPAVCGTAWQSLSSVLSIPANACNGITASPPVHIHDGGCGCTVGDGVPWLAALAWLFFASARRR